jgi:hypothetical protein
MPYSAKSNGVCHHGGETCQGNWKIGDQIGFKSQGGKSVPICLNCADEANDSSSASQRNGSEADASFPGLASASKSSSRQIRLIETFVRMWAEKNGFDFAAWYEMTAPAPKEPKAKGAPKEQSDPSSEIAEHPVIKRWLESGKAKEDQIFYWFEAAQRYETYEAFAEANKGLTLEPGFHEFIREVLPVLNNVRSMA